jgi:tRNA pseudouridine38-40 synthase
MAERTVQLVLHYDGSGFSGWQRQPDQRTVQGVMEAALERLCGAPIGVLGAGRTDAGVHARGQAAGVHVPDKWRCPELRRALNAVLPADVWVAAAHEMRADFHARFSAVARHYVYYVGTDEDADSPFRRRYEYVVRRPVDRGALYDAARQLVGSHCFRAFAVQGTAPAGDSHASTITRAEWRDEGGRLAFEIEANRFLHHMVRFLVGTMMDIATGHRPAADLPRLLVASDNREVSPPAPAHALFLQAVTYPAEFYAS